MSQRQYPIPKDDADYNNRMVEKHPESGTRTITYMAPNEYHKAVNRPVPYGSSVEKLKNDIAENGLKHMPWIKYDEKNQLTGQEGRHRVEALSKLGYDQVPVVIHRSSTDKVRDT